MNICVCLVKISWIYCFLFRLCSRLLHKDVEANPDMFPKRCYSRVLLMTPTWQFTEFGGELSFTPWSHVRQGYTFLYPVLTLEIGACRDSVAWLWQVHLRASVVFPLQCPLLALPWSDLLAPRDTHLSCACSISWPVEHSPTQLSLHCWFWKVWF